AAKQDVVLHRKIGKKLTPHGHVRQTSFGHLMWLQPGDLLSLEENAAFPRPDHPGYGSQNGRLSAAVATHQTYKLVLSHFQRNIKNHLQGAVSEVDSFDL